QKTVNLTHNKIPSLHDDLPISVKILSSSGAYWRGSEKNKMLQRIYAISFPKASQLQEHLDFLEEVKQRDHRKIGKELEIFMTHKDRKSTRLNFSHVSISYAVFC